MADGGFVDHHVHLLRVAAGVLPPYDAADPASIEAFHRRLAAEGTDPMELPPAPPARDDLPGAIEAGLRRAAGYGIEQLTEAGMADWGHWQALIALRARSGDGTLPTRVRILVASGSADLARMAAANLEADDQLRITGVKFYGDGWLGSRTCACSKPFADRVTGTPQATGVLFRDADELARRVAPVAEAGWQVATHAIGDRAIETVLDAYEQAYGGAEAVADPSHPRPRIEHAQVLRPDLIERMAALRVTACIQPCFAASDAATAAAGLGDQFPEAYRWDLLLAAGVDLIAGSDYPIETLDPAEGLAHLTSGDHPLPGEVARRLMTDPRD